MNPNNDASVWMPFGEGSDHERGLVLESRVTLRPAQTANSFGKLAGN
jgi:hypothetical protein